MRSVAIICSYGHQDFYRVLGRDPLKQPMSVLERELFAHLLLEVWEAKVSPAIGISSMIGGDTDSLVNE